MARTRGRSAGATAAATRTRREQQLENSTQLQSSQFENVEANLQQRAEQEPGQTERGDRGRGRSEGRARVGGRGRGRVPGRGGRGGKASAEPLSKHQQEASNGEGFYEVFQI